MARIIILLIALTIATTMAQIQCPPGQILFDCDVDCPTDYCPKNPGDEQTDCSPPFVCPSFVCKCPAGQRKDDSGNCINFSDCPPIPSE